MTAGERVAPQVPVGGVPQEKDKSIPLSSLQNSFSEAVDGAFLSVLLQHALDNLSATAYASTGEGKTKSLTSGAEGVTLPRLCALTTANGRTMRSPGSAVGMGMTSLAPSNNYMSTVSLDRFCDSTRQRQACTAPTGGPVESEVVDGHGRHVGIRRVSKGGTPQAETVAADVCVHDELVSGSSEAGAADLGGRDSVTPGGSSASLAGSAVALLTPNSTLSKSILKVDDDSSQGTALIKFAGGVEVEKVPALGKNGRVSLMLKVCPQFPSLCMADATKPHALPAFEAAASAGLPCGSNDLFHKPTPTATTPESVTNQSLEYASETAKRDLPFHVMLTRLCDDADAPLPNCAEKSFLQKDKDELWQKQLSNYEPDREKANGRRVHNLPTMHLQTLVPDMAPVLQGSPGPTAIDEGLAAAWQELLTGRAQGLSSGNVCDVPGALLQQQSVGRALLTRLASLQVQQALLRCTFSLPQSQPQETMPFHMRTHEDEAHVRDEVAVRPSTCGQGPPMSQRRPQGEWPVLFSGEERSAWAHAHLQHSELFSLMQNHTTCVFHFVVRALCLLANCCPLWAAAGNEGGPESNAANAAYSFPAPLFDGGGKRTHPPAATALYQSREKRVFGATPAHDGAEPVSRLECGDSAVTAAEDADPCGTESISPPDSVNNFPAETGRDLSKIITLFQASPPSGNGRISSYRWHWMHVVSFLTHPELLSVYHSTLAPLLTLFIQDAQPGVSKHCARIESLDTSSSHDDELSTAAEHITEKASQSNQRQNSDSFSSSCCGAESWLVIRQVLCDLDDLRVLHDPTFSPRPQWHDFSCVQLQQQQIKQDFHSRHACCAVLSQHTPLICCSGPRCNDKCPGTYYCGSALLRSSIFFGSFIEASKALAVWPQYLAATAAAALPFSGILGQCGQSALVTTAAEDAETEPRSLERRKHKCVSHISEPTASTSLPPRARWHSEQGTGSDSRVGCECSSHTKNDLSDAARGVAACILKHVDLNKLDSTELLALLKLTEEAGGGTTSPLSAFEEHDKPVQEANKTHIPGAVAPLLSPVPTCQPSHTKTSPVPKSGGADIASPAASTLASLKCTHDELKVDWQPVFQSQSVRTLCPTSAEERQFRGAMDGEAEFVVSGDNVSRGHSASDEALAVAVSTGADLATFAKGRTSNLEEKPTMFGTDEKVPLPEEARKSLIRFSPLFSPLKSQPIISPLPESDQNNTLAHKLKAVAAARPECHGERPPIGGPLNHRSPAFCGLLSPDESSEKTNHVGCVLGAGHSPRAQRDEIVANSLRASDTGGRETSLSLPEASLDRETDLFQVADPTTRCHPSTASPTRGAFLDEPLTSAASAPKVTTKNVVYRSACGRVGFQKSAASASQNSVAETHGKDEVSAPYGSSALNTNFMSLLVAVAPTQVNHTDVATICGPVRLSGDEGSFTEKQGESTNAVSALDIIEHERALSLVAAGVRNTRKRFRLQSVKRKAETRVHYDESCLTLCTDGSSWDHKTSAHGSSRNVSPKQQPAPEQLHSPQEPIPAIAESSFCKLASAPASGGLPAGRRRNGSNTTLATSGNNTNFNNACQVRSPVKGIYYDSYKKLWRVQWNSSSATPQQATTNAPVSSTGHGGAGRRVSRSFSCARLGFEAAKARAIAWMLSGGHVGDGGLSDVFQRASSDTSASRAGGPAASGVIGASRPPKKDEVEGNTSGYHAKLQRGAGRQELEQEQKEKLLFANPKLFLERVEAFYVRNGLYGLQCGNAPAGGPTERQRSDTKECEEQHNGTGPCSGAASQVGNSRKGNGGTGGLRIVSVLSLDDMLDIVQGKKITMSFPYVALKHTAVDGQGRTAISEVALGANCSHTSSEGQHQVWRQRRLVHEDMPNHTSQPCFKHPDPNADLARKKTRVREAAGSEEEASGGQIRKMPSFDEGKLDGEGSA